MAYNPTVYVNDNPPAINADNLNKSEKGIHDNSVQGENNENVISNFGITEFYQGSITGLNGNISTLSFGSSTTRLRSAQLESNKRDLLLVGNAALYCKAASGYKYFVQLYDKDTGAPAFSNGNFAEGEHYYSYENDANVVIVLGKTDNSAITPSDVENNFQFFYTIRQFEKMGKEFSDSIQDLSDELNDVEKYIYTNGSIIETMYQGGIASAAQGNNINNFTTSDATNVIRSVTTSNRKNILIPANNSIYISVDAGYRFAYQVYSKATSLALDTFTWQTARKTITKTEDIYLIIMVSKLDQSTITPDAVSHLRVSYFEENTLKEDINQKVDYVNAQNLTEAQKLRARQNIGVQNQDVTEITYPFTFDMGVKLYKTTEKYFTDFVPQSKAITKVNGVVVFVSTNGDDSNDGLTISTPKKTFESALAVSDVTSLILLEGNYNVGTHFTAGLTVSADINIIGIGNVVISSGTGNPVTFTGNLYCENVIFSGGNNTVIFKPTTASKTGTFYHCKFKNSYRLNGLSIQGGKAYVVECEAFDNAYDGFNYHANDTDSIIAKSIEIGCKAYNNGLINLSGTEGQSSNASTSHDNCDIIRVNGEYHTCHGGVVADKQCNSACYGSRAGISTVTDSNYPDRMSNYWCSYGSMWLYDCVSYGSKYDTAKINGGTITSNVTYNSNYPS